MSDSTVRCWLVERTVDDRNLVHLVYATPDGERYQKRQRNATALRSGSPVTAAVEVDADELVVVDDQETRDRYSAEARRTATQHEPGDEL